MHQRAFPGSTGAPAVSFAIVDAKGFRTSPTAPGGSRANHAGMLESGICRRECGFGGSLDLRLFEGREFV